MNTTTQWKKTNRLDSVFNVLLIVLALGVLGAGAFETAFDAARLDTARVEAPANQS